MDCGDDGAWTTDDNFYGVSHEAVIIICHVEPFDRLRTSPSTSSGQARETPRSFQRTVADEIHQVACPDGRRVAQKHTMSDRSASSAPVANRRFC